MAGEALDELEEVGLGDLGDLDEGGMTKGVKAEPARAERELGLALQPRRLDIGEDEAAGNRPFPGIAGILEDVKGGLVAAKIGRGLCWERMCLYVWTLVFFPILIKSKIYN